MITAHRQALLGELRFEKLSPHLFHLEPEALRSVARYHTILATLCRRRALELEERRRHDEASRKAAAARPWPDTPYHRKIRRREILAERNVEIMRLAARGWPNERIARRMDLSPGSISRIVQGELKRTRRDP